MSDDGKIDRQKTKLRKSNSEFFSIRFWRFRLSRKLWPINISYCYVKSYRSNYYQLLYKLEFQQIYCFAIALDCKSKSLVFNSKTMNSVTITKIIGVTIINNLITNPYRLYWIWQFLKWIEQQAQIPLTL